MGVTFNVGKDLCSSFLYDHISAEIVNDIDLFNIFQKPSADFNQIQNEAQWELFWQVVDFDQNCTIFIDTIQWIFKLSDGLFHFSFQEKFWFKGV